MHFWELLINKSANLYYLNLLLFILGAGLFLQGINKTIQIKEGPIFLTYSFASCTIYLIATFITDPLIVGNNSTVINSNALETIVQLIELTTYFIFFYTLVKMKSLKIVVLTLYLLAIAGYFLFYSKANTDPVFLSLTITRLTHIIEQLLIFLIAFVYLLKLLIKPDCQIKLNESPWFWILTGASLYCGLSISLSLISPMTKNDKITQYLFLVLPFYINALFIKKSLICKSIQLT